MKIKLCLALLLGVMFNTLTSQVVINKVWEQATGHPTLAYDHIATARQGSEVFIVGNTYHFGEQENFLITKYNTSGTLLWQKEFNSLTGDRDFGMDAYIKGTHLYVTGFSWDSLANDADIVTLKLTMDSGNTVWSATYAGAYGGYDAAAGVRVDNSGNVFVAGSEQTGVMDSKMIVIKYNSSGTQQWITSYDSTGYFDGAVALDMDAGGSRLKTIGFSGSAFSSWDFVTHEFNSSGGVTGYIRSANPNGGISKPIGFTQDFSGDLYVLGNIALSGTNNDIKLIKYDTLFNQVWVRTFGSADSLDDEAAAIAVDAQGRILISGFTSRSNGATDMLTLKYDKNGNIVWSRTISSSDLTKDATGRDVRIENNSSNNVYVTGKIYNNGNYDYLSASYTKDGDLRWVEYFDDTTGSNDVGLDVVVDNSNNVIVSGICVKDTTTRYVSVKYEQQPDSLGLGVIVPKQFLDGISYMDYVFEGTVIAKNSYLNTAKNVIYTSNTVEISRIYKGSLECGTVELITMGGTVDTLTLLLSHNLELGVGETGLFLAEPTSREVSATDFYPETNSDKLFIPYGEEGFIKYYTDSVNHIITLSWGAWDSLTPIYNLFSYTCGTPYVCERSMPVPNDESSLEKMELPHYTKEEFDYQMSIGNQKAGRATQLAERSIGTITYEFQNPIVTGSTTKYLEFDVAISDNLSAGWFYNGLVHILYNTSVFGSDVVANSKIEVTKGTIMNYSADYMDPVPGDFSTGVVAIPISAEINSFNLFELTSTPTIAIHVKMEIANCNVSGSSIQMTNNSTMALLSFYTGIPNPTDTTPWYTYSVVDNSSSFPMPLCKPTITSFSPDQLNAGVGDVLSISGFQFGATRGNGGVFMKNNNDGGATDVKLDDMDYVLWSDTLIQVKVPSETDTSHNGLSKRAGTGTGIVKVKSNAGDIGSSTSPVTVGYAANNTIETFSGTPKKYLAMLRDNGLAGTGGYKFHIDSSVYNKPSIKATIGKAIREWVCLTTVNFQMGSDTILSLSGAILDKVNLIHFGFDDSANVAARTAQWFSQCTSSDKMTVREIDLSINPMFYNNFTVDTTGTVSIPSGKLDFYQIVLHELGHGHSLGHVNDPNSIMWWFSPSTGISASQRRIRLYNDAPCYEGGSYVIGNSATSLAGSCYPAMTPLFGNVCTPYNNIRKPDAVSGSVKLYPNPNSNYLNIEYLLSGRSGIQVTVHSITGSLVFSSAIAYEETGTHTITLPTFAWANGFYLVNVRVNGQNNVAKVIKN